jgi:hypothetical protein
MMDKSVHWMVGCAQICNLKLELKLSPTFCHFGTDACIMAVDQDM